MRTIPETREQSKPTNTTSQREQLKLKEWHNKLNQVYCLSAAGKLLYDVCRHEIGCDVDSCIITGLRRSKLLAMRDRDVVSFTLDDLQDAAQSCFWQLLTSYDQYGYSVVLNCSGKTYKTRGAWNDDQQEYLKAKQAREARHEKEKQDAYFSKWC